MQAIYRRMQTERQREAAEFRAEGEGAARRIRATADREVTVIKADATGSAERTKGEAMRNETASMPTPSTRIRTSFRSTGRCRPTRRR